MTDTNLAAVLSAPRRLAALRATGMLDSPSEQGFDRLADLARRALGAPVCLVSLVDAERQFFKSCVGLPEPWATRRETPLSHSFCQHVVGTGEPLVVEDARLHPLLRENLAVRDLNVIAYLGIPLLTPDALTIGSFCVIDTRPRAWTPDQIALMRDLAVSVMSEIALRHTTIQALRESEAELRRRNAELRDAIKDADSARLQAERAEANLQRLNATLEQRVRAEIGEREEAHARLAQAQKLSALGQLAGGVAHDFNNIAQAVTGGASMIARHAEDPAKVRRYAAMLVESAARAKSVTRRLLSLARRGDLKADSVEVAPLLHGLCEFLAHSLGANVALRVETPPGLLPVLVDKGLLETALVNLATNARDAIAGNGSITFAAAMARLPLGREQIGLVAGDYVQITVADTGSGMDAATADRAMEPFFTTKEPGKGTGLGLPMAKGFAEQSGGALEVKSAVGCGTTVSIWLPIADAAAPSPRVESACATAPGEARRILLVDDEDAVREVLKGELVDAGFEVIDAPGGVLALAAIEAGERVDLLVSDLSMAGMDGLELIRAAQKIRGRLPAILLTGYAGDAATLALGDIASGPICLLRKPITGSELADRAAMMIERNDPGDQPS